MTYHTVNQLIIFITCVKCTYKRKTYFYLLTVKGKGNARKEVGHGIISPLFSNPPPLKNENWDVLIGLSSQFSTIQFTCCQEF